MKDYNQLSIEMHKLFGGKIEMMSKVPLKNVQDLSLAYTPGVAAPCLEIEKDSDQGKVLTWRKNLVAVITDGSAVLGLKNIGGEAAMPVMEGKCALFKRFAGVDAVPICLRTQDTEEIINIVKNLEPSFGGINLEDIAAPRCFEIESRLKNELTIPVFHDDQHGTAVVTLAALVNALKIVQKQIDSIKIVFSGAGAAGIAIAKLLLSAGAKNIIICDSQGALSKKRDDLNFPKQEILSLTNPNNESGSLQQIIQGADVFIGVSAPNLLSRKEIKTMRKGAIIFAMANPVPEIMPDEALKGGAAIVATGRSDFPNQINNVLVFPGIFRGVFDSGKAKITNSMLLVAAYALAKHISHPTKEKILPNVFDLGVSDVIASALQVSKE
jgi:malate dehydrogenase (oxaloacetate-decarboxylating)